LLQLNSTTLRDFLADVFFGDKKADYVKYIVPLQGNWWLPTEKDSTSSTWIGYNIVSVEPMIRAHWVTNDTGTAMVSTCKATVHLQCIGADAETIARSLIHWDERVDVAIAFHRFAGQLMYDKRKVITSLYFQDGQNSTLSYNVDFRFLFADVVEPKLDKLIEADIHGNVYY
jgi:hypothetical protein